MTTTKKVLNLESYKEKQKAKVIIKDLIEILALIDNASQSLNNYRKYVLVKEVLNSLKSNREIIKIYLRKYRKIMNGNKI